jgi:predicted dehydrogenase
MKIVTDKGTIYVDGFGRRADIYLENKPAMNHLYENDMNTTILADFKHCIEEDLPAPVTGLDGLYPVEIANLAYQSAHTKKIITLNR